MKGNVLTICIGLLMGIVIGSSITWYLTSDFVGNAVVEAELKFNELLETERAKHNKKVGKLEDIKGKLEQILIASDTKIDSLSTTISTRNQELNQIKKELNEQISSIDGMSHNELADFFAKRYGN